MSDNTVYGPDKPPLHFNTITHFFYFEIYFVTQVVNEPYV